MVRKWRHWGAALGNQPGSAPTAVRLSFAWIPRLFQPLCKYFLTAVQSQGSGCRAGSGCGLQGQQQERDSRPPARRALNSNNKRGCTKGTHVSYHRLETPLGTQPALHTLASSHSPQQVQGPSPWWQSGKETPGLSEGQGRVDIHRDPGPHAVPGNPVPQTRVSMSRSERSFKCPPVQPCLGSLPPPQESGSQMGLACGQHHLVWETPLL